MKKNQLQTVKVEGNYHVIKKCGLMGIVNSIIENEVKGKVGYPFAIMWNSDPRCIEIIDGY